ncbi:double-strand break repair protein AddB [Neotabrizicola sp. VNH66]|uniref:double-strand break repair protein AddB n=1 Tax=Neotabrizicola sp. VNH66 TaxID=3400918 RepID=UPI003C0502A1
MRLGPADMRLFGLPPGADFPERLATGLLERLSGTPPEALARVTLFLNTQRLRRRLRTAFMAGGATLLPRMRLVSELGADPLVAPAGPSVSSLGRRLELAVLIGRLLEAEPDLAPRFALYDLGDSLAALMDEMRAEDVPPERLMQMNLEAHAAHWSRTRRFIELVERFFGTSAAPDAEARQRLATLAQIARWRAAPPADPVIVAGSTGSRGTTALLMRAVAGLPQGALVVPGYDFDLPAAVWDSMDAGPGAEDHPQFRYRRLMQALDLAPGQVLPWQDAPPPDPLRNRLVSLALRPAPVTDQWIAEGPGLGDLTPLADRVTLVEAPDPRSEAGALALCLRQAVGQGRRVALISPDRDLVRRVTAALDRWGIRPDDSGGQPLRHSAPGRLLRLVMRAMGTRPMADELLVLLKHPLAFRGGARGEHLLLTRKLELELRSKGPAFPDPAFLQSWAATQPEADAALWGERLGHWLEDLAATGPAPLADLSARHRRLAEALVRGTGTESAALWDRAAGQDAQAAMTELAEQAPASLELTPAAYAELFDAILSRRQVREAVTVDSRVEVLGAQEARVQGADLVILSGLTEGIWPAQPAPDPWLNRRMRMEAGLLLPERRIGLSAHDFQMAMAAPEIVISRAARDAEAETVPSRWLNRLTNLLDGLSSNGGQAALAGMRAKGRALLEQAAALERPLPLPRAGRPAPRPPLADRPQRLSLTEVERLVRDPYAIYARHVLRLRPLSPVRPLADARLRGEVLHRVPEAFLRGAVPADPAAAADRLMQITDEVLAEAVAWPAMRAVWRARMADLALPFAESVLQAGRVPVALERKYEIDIPGLDFRLVGKPDRIDMGDDGTLHIVDYKTGTPPSPEQQKNFAKQLHLAAVMALLGAFPEVGPHDRVAIAYVQLKRDLKTVAATLEAEDLAHVLEEFRALITAWRNPRRGYTSRRAMFETRDQGDYDDLARYGEWDVTDDPAPEDVP